MRLSKAFAEGWAVRLDSADAESRLAALVARGQRSHPELTVDQAIFVRQLARCASRIGAAPLDAAESLAIDDLYLGCACALGVAGGAAAFEARCGTAMRKALASVVKSDDRRTEAEQHARDVLIVGNGDRPPKIGEYSGLGPIDCWVGVVVRGLARSMIRSEDAEHRARDRATTQAASGSVQPEAEFAKQRYRADFESAFSRALDALNARDKALLRLLVRGVSVEKIGKMYSVSQSTASRWLAEARERVSAEGQRLLREKLGISRDEMASLAGLVASQLDISMSRLLSSNRQA